MGDSSSTAKPEAGASASALSRIPHTRSQSVAAFNGAQLTVSERRLVEEGLRYIGGHDLSYLSEQLRAVCDVHRVTFNKSVALGVACAGVALKNPAVIETYQKLCYSHYYTVGSDSAIVLSSQIVNNEVESMFAYDDGSDTLLIHKTVRVAKRVTWEVKEQDSSTSDVPAVEWCWQYRKYQQRPTIYLSKSLIDAAVAAPAPGGKQYAFALYISVTMLHELAHHARFYIMRIVNDPATAYAYDDQFTCCVVLSAGRATQRTVHRALHKLKINDTVLVENGNMIPVDGQITWMSTSSSSSSIADGLAVGNRVTAGSVNGSGAHLHVQVETGGVKMSDEDSETPVQLYIRLSTVQQIQIQQHSASTSTSTPDKQQQIPSDEDKLLTPDKAKGSECGYAFEDEVFGVRLCLLYDEVSVKQEPDLASKIYTQLSLNGYDFIPVKLRGARWCMQLPFLQLPSLFTYEHWRSGELQISIDELSRHALKVHEKIASRKDMSDTDDEDDEPSSDSDEVLVEPRSHCFTTP